MKKQDFTSLRQKAIKLVTTSLEIRYKDDDEYINDIQDVMLHDFNKLPEHPEILRTINGIIGFNKFLKGTNERLIDKQFDHAKFLTNSLHDIAECLKNYKEPWFSPRLSRFSN